MQKRFTPGHRSTLPFLALFFALLIGPTAWADGSNSMGRVGPRLPDPNWRPTGLVRLPAQPGWRVRRPHRAYGTGLAVSRLVSVLRATHSRFPAAPPINVYDLSKFGGGKLEGHHSHRRGRDADIGLPINLESSNWRKRERTAERMFFFVMSLLRSCDVEFILVDYRLQRILLHHALSRGVTADEAALIFQYPGKGPFGMIRHRQNHRRHIHVRFRKEESSSEPPRQPLIRPDRESKEELCYHPEDLRGPRNLIQKIFLRLYGD